jgi:hypothetical protein
MMLTEIPKELIKPVLARQTGFRFSNITESPFAEEGRSVSRGLQQTGDCHIVGLKSLSRWIHSPRVASHTRVAVMLSGHQHAARRSTDGCASIEPSEPKSVGRHFVQMRSLDDGLTVAAKFAVTKIVGQNENEIRLCSWL